MQEQLRQEPKSLQKALEQKEQLETRIANERSKYAADLRTAQSLVIGLTMRILSIVVFIV